MPASSGTKGNPASHRMSNKALKERRAQSWRNGQKRKEERREEMKRRQVANLQRRINGEPTPWEAAKTARRLRRAAVLAKAKGKS